MLSRRSLCLCILLAILLLALAACDPVARPFLVIHQVTSGDDSVYAYAVRRRGFGVGCCAYGTPAFFSSEDGGQTWVEIETPPSALEQSMQEARARTNQGCDGDSPGRCFRVDGLGRVLESSSGGKDWYEGVDYAISDQERELAFKSLDYSAICSETSPLICFRLGEQGQIESSLDGGASWRSDWELAEGRGAYVVRIAARDKPGVPMDTRPLDLAVLDTAEGVSVIAAMGNQGVMVRTPQGSWERRSVEAARPWPYQAKSLRDAVKAVLPDVALLLMIASLFAALLSGTTAVALRSLAQGTAMSSFRRWLPAWVGVGLVVSALFLVQGRGLLGFVETFALVLGWFLALGVLFVNWLVVREAAKKGGWLGVARMTGLKSPLIVLVAALPPHFLWALGVITSRQAAVWLSGGLGSLAAVLCLVRTTRLAAKAARMPRFKRDK